MCIRDRSIGILPVDTEKGISATVSIDRMSMDKKLSNANKMCIRDRYRIPLYHIYPNFYTLVQAPYLCLNIKPVVIIFFSYPVSYTHLDVYKRQVLTKGVDVVCIFVNDTADAEVIRAMADNGVPFK